MGLIDVLGNAPRRHTRHGATTSEEGAAAGFRDAEGFRGGISEGAERA